MRYDKSNLFFKHIASTGNEVHERLQGRIFPSGFFVSAGFYFNRCDMRKESYSDKLKSPKWQKNLWI